MDSRTYKKHRIFAAILFLCVVGSGANYYLGLGTFGRFDKLVMILVVGVIAVYGGFFAPTREDMRAHRASSNNRWRGP